MKTVRVGLVGCGSVAQQVHLEILKRMPGVDLVAFAEPDPARRAQAAHKMPSARACEDYEGVLTATDVDAVLLCLPNALHAPAAVEASQRGKHIYVEKPLAMDLDEGRRVLEAWRRSGLVGMVGFNYRFNALYGAARQLIRSGRLGGLVGARSVFSTPSHALPEWRRTRQTGGGVLLDLASHHVDLMRFLFDEEVRDVSASSRSVRSEGDSAVIQFRLGRELLVQSFFSASAVDDDRIEVYGQEGRLSVDRYRSVDVEVAPSSRLGSLLGGVKSLRKIRYLLEKLRAPAHEPSFSAALAEFFAAVRENRPASPDLVDGYRSLAVIRAAEESADTGRVVALSETDHADIAG